MSPLSMKISCQASSWIILYSCLLFGSGIYCDRKLERRQAEVQANSCVLPTVEGVLYTHEESNEILPHGSLINIGLAINEHCEVGYHKVNPDSFRVCQRSGKWKSVTDKSCLKMCPPLISDSSDITCSYHGRYSNCSNLSIPDTIATQSCKSTYNIPTGQEETPLELHCEYNGIWNNTLYRCNPRAVEP